MLLKSSGTITPASRERFPAIDYTPVTEVPGIRATREQMSMLYTRYHLAAMCAEGRSVLEVACGGGTGLAYLAARASRIVGGDYTPNLLRIAQRHSARGIPLVQLDAHELPFQAESFDVVILYEAIYYLADPLRFLHECRRVLNKEGTLLICTVNREWQEFNPSPMSRRYFSAKELAEAMEKHGFEVSLFGAFPVSRETTKDQVISILKRVASSLHLIPKSMKGKETLKRLFFGRLSPIPPEVMDGMADQCPLAPLTAGSVVSDYKVLYAIGRLQ